jgi:drug/metabolite transporter (DMT)-like permease
VNLDELRWFRPDLDCEPLQAQGILAIFNRTRQMNSRNTFRLGVAFAAASAFTFGMSGPLAKSLMEAGWTPVAAVTARLAGGALVMAVYATVVHRGWLREAVEHGKTVVMYGLIPIAGAQLCYYNAVAHLSVGVALLLEYLAPVLVVGWVWGTARRRPATLTLTGAMLALTGTVVVRCPTGSLPTAAGCTR